MMMLFKKEEIKAMQDISNQVIVSVQEEYPELEVEMVNMIDEIKAQGSRAMEIKELPDGSIAIDVNVEYMLESLAIYKDTITKIVPLAIKFMKVMDSTAMSLMTLASKWI